MNTAAITKIIQNLKSFKDAYLKEKDDLDQEIWQCLKATNIVQKAEPFFLFLRGYNSFTPALPPRLRLVLRGYPPDQIGMCFEDIKEGIYKKYKNHRLFTDVRGGGCFLSWKGKGIAIDPGYDFIENIYCEELAIGDLDAIIVTHAHSDHYMDLVSVLTLAYRYNRLSNAYLNIHAQQPKAAIPFLEELMQIYPQKFVYDALIYCLDRTGEFEDIGISIERIKQISREFEATFNKDIMPNIGRYQKKTITLFFSDSAYTSLNNLLETKDAQGKTKCLGDADGPYPLDDKKLGITVELSETKHNDFKRITGNGLKFDLQGFKIGITSDTGWFEKNEPKPYGSGTFQKEIKEYFSDCDLLIPHIGSINENEFWWLELDDDEKERRFKKYLYKTHLGILGLLRLVTDIKNTFNNRLKIVGITEFGEEMKHMRHKLAEEMNKCNKIASGTKYLAADIGLKIRLPYRSRDLKIVQELGVRVGKDPKTGNEEYEKPDDVKEEIDWLTGRIRYRKKS